MCRATTIEKPTTTKRRWFPRLSLRRRLWPPPSVGSARAGPPARGGLRRKLTRASLYSRVLPTRLLSRAWGLLHGVSLPPWLRAPLLGLYVWAFRVDMTEAAERDLRRYRNLGELFRRPLRPGARPVSGPHSLVSPADGQVLHVGCVEPDGRLEQVKGLSYSLQAFLGPLGSLAGGQRITHPGCPELVSVREGGALYHCVVYLAPGDYHRFHSPSRWLLQHRRHFPGCLMSVNPGVAHYVRELFCVNERVVLSGSWEHGFISLTAVGATNVGSIRVYRDEELVTNRRRHSLLSFMDRSFTSHPGLAGGAGLPVKGAEPTTAGAGPATSGAGLAEDGAGSAADGAGLGRDGAGLDDNWAWPGSEGAGLVLEKAEPVGEFNLGSTVVLVFEAPARFRFRVKPGQRIRYGEPLGNM